VVGHAFLKPMDLRAVAHVFRLMATLIDWALRTRVEKIELIVRSTNQPAIRLYRKFGFVEEGRFRNRVRLADGDYIDDVSMAWFPKRPAV
jgi:putative acetyltransferase